VLKVAALSAALIVVRRAPRCRTGRHPRSGGQPIRPETERFAFSCSRNHSLSGTT